VEKLVLAYRSLLEACAFAARAHRHQLRKDGETPYVSHAFRVCLVARDVFGIDDKQLLTVALLHDTVEDTATDFDDIKQAFGDEVANWVSALSKDKRIPEAQREIAYEKQLAAAPWQVKVCKLADIFDNLVDSVHMSPKQQAKNKANARRYLKALQDGLPEAVRPAWQIVSRLLADLESTK
jgi:guanosine-3',5'-bis(diphosphate) 3'-pyrophosphohydrolase